MYSIDQLDEKLKHVCHAFCIEGVYQSYEEIKVGNVNRTYKVNFLRDDGTPKSYVVQAVNTYVFKKPVEVMSNIDRVTEHIRSKKQGRIALHFHHTKDRKTFLIDENGFWRLFNYIPSETHNVCHQLEIIRNAGEAFGEFQMMLSDFSASELYVTIPDFHDTRKRFATLWKDVEQDPLGKVREVTEELKWLKSAEENACVLTDLYNQGELPLRVTHNDTKINNVLFEREGNQAIVVIDLDTVMPGLVGHDFGDAIRFAANHVAEDSPQYASAGLDMDVFRAFAEGFLAHTARTLTDREIETLPISCFVLTVELATRFLDDYINGSPYFKIAYPEHNLVRTRCQIALAKDMLKKMEAMTCIIRECVQKIRGDA
ncbi:MAG: aminoglycoside phosphotransferase family protein [Christensenellales bacterium]|nr:aminoglycoside phosphotransferase family protein [Christensenellales bacterium]